MVGVESLVAVVVGGVASILLGPEAIPVGVGLVWAVLVVDTVLVGGGGFVAGGAVPVVG